MLARSSWIPVFAGGLFFHGDNAYLAAIDKKPLEHSAPGPHLIESFLGNESGKHRGILLGDAKLTGHLPESATDNLETIIRRFSTEFSNRLLRNFH